MYRSRAVLMLSQSYVPLLLSQKAKKIRFETKNWAVRSKMDEQQVGLTSSYMTPVLDD